MAYHWQPRIETLVPTNDHKPSATESQHIDEDHGIVNTDND